ncbi:MAG: RluA family pseudouridine synthase [Leptospirales bacterium]
MKRIDPSAGIDRLRQMLPPGPDGEDPADISTNCRMYQVDPGESKKRLDHFLAQSCLPFSRSRIQKILDEGLITVNGRIEPASYRIRGKDLITVHIPPPSPAEDAPEEMDLDILYEDPSLLVIIKPPALVVHPAPGHPNGTLLNGLLGYLTKGETEESEGPARAGLVHRLDQDTSGLMVVGKSSEVVDQLMVQFRDRHVSKSYLALAIGILPSKRGLIDAPIGRSSGDRKKFAVTASGKPSQTRYRVVTSYAEGYSLLDITLLTGRTHQIRVHMHHLGHPLAGDPVYRKRGRKETHPFPRIMLHAAKLGFTHPVTNERLNFSAPLPKDMEEALSTLHPLAPDPATDVKP